ncbi:hypothetical protein EDD22DRAFT_977211 [Suillus occidentalis]|nr:hypothetical protein EDD22DRAFT_977211 [Suillus occidentalis]
MRTDIETSPRKRRILPDKSTDALYANWQKLIPTLIDPQLSYHARTLGQALEKTHDVISACGTDTCAHKRTNLLCLFFDSNLPQVLLHHGLFPTSPSQPRMAVSVDLLSFYRALFERSCDAINALASALKTHYSRRGFQVTDARVRSICLGELVQEPFRRGLGYAVQWYDVLQVEIERQVDTVLQQSRDRVANLQPPQPPQPPQSSDSIVLHRERCAPLLAQRCPACFGGTLFGRPIEEGGDIHVATDGNFHHRHRRSAGDCPRFYEPTYFLSKQFVDARPAKAHVPLVPDEAIDLCENAYEAADGKKQKAAMDSFDDTGIMALICRHDIPLFFANIDTPGEQQKYLVALIEHLFTLLPPQATVVTLYDVGCVLARSLSKFDILPQDVLLRLCFVTTAMHTYGHEWACQLVHNPRMCVGMGLSDGEGTERLWSRFIRLIGVERSSSRQRRIWLIDRQATAIGSEMKDDLGDWIKRRLKRGIKDQGSVALDAINRCEISVEDLQAQWTDQRQSQLSIRAHAPARLRKELDTVLALQSDLDASDRALQTTRTTLEKDAASGDTLDVLESLQRGHDRLMAKVEALYSSLNVHDRFPELNGVNLDFVRVLLIARDLKMNIRKCAIASFFEWDKLDRAVGGSQQTLGTKLHQHTRKAIAKRQPALMTAIRKFNTYCERLELLYDPAWNIPLPTPLPTKLAELRGDQTLMQDVWVTPSIGEEEQRRLGMEADNLCCFFGEELTALELSLRLPENKRFVVPLQQRRSHFLRLQTRWANSLASSVRFTSRAKEALDCAIAYSGGPQSTALCLASVTVQDPVPEDEAVLPEVDDLAEVEPEQAALADILEGDVAGAEIDEDEDIVHNVCADIVWDPPEGLLIDDFRVPSQDSHTIMRGHVATRTTSSTGGFPQQVFEPRDISFLTHPTAFLNDMDTPNPTVAIFSTHDLPRICYNAVDDILWRNTSWTRYWEKDVWVLPIHRPANVGHWVVCVIYLSRKELHLFDSLAEQKPWKHDVKDIMKLVCRLLMIACQREKEVHVNLDGWVARPLTVKSLQTNGYDCGVWILAAMIAVLCGRHITRLQEDEMSDLRYYLRARILSIPVF